MNVVPAFRMSNTVTTARAGAAAVWLAIMLGTAGQTFGQSPGSDPVIAVVNGTQIHESEVKMVDEIIGRNLPTQDFVERRESILKILIDTVLLAEVAKERKIEEDADIQHRITFARNQGLMNHVLSTVSKQAVTEEAISKTYDEVVLRAAKSEPELHLRHIVFFIPEPKDDAAVKAAEQKANQALDRIKKGEDFAAVATDVSEDPVTKARGGDFDWRLRGELGKEYADAAFRLKTGEVSLFKTGVGWHIVKLEDQRARKSLSLEALHDRLAALVASKAQLELIDRVRTDAKIERLDKPNTADNGAPKEN